MAISSISRYSTEHNDGSLVFKHTFATQIIRKQCYVGWYNGNDKCFIDAWSTAQTEAELVADKLALLAELMEEKK